MDARQFEDKFTYQQYFSNILRWIIIGLGLTFGSSIIFSFFDLYNVFGLSLILIPIIEIIMVLVLNHNLNKLDYSKAKTWYIAYAFINGLTFSIICDFVAPNAFVLASLITFAYFGLLYTIVKNTSYSFITLKNICISLLIPLCIGFIVTLIFSLSYLYMILIVVDLLLFTGITLFDIKNIEISYQDINHVNQNTLALRCAFDLYLDYINIFYDIIMIINDLS